MTRISRAAVGAIAIALAAAPIASAIAGGYGSHHGNRHHGHGYYGNPFAPVVGLAAAVVGTAAAIVTLPFAILGAATAPAYYAPPGPRQGYYPPARQWRARLRRAVRVLPRAASVELVCPAVGAISIRPAAFAEYVCAARTL
jgi:hypothetical protein